MVDPSAFTISFMIETFNLIKVLCDLGASINLIPFVIYKYLGSKRTLMPRQWGLMGKGPT